MKEEEVTTILRELIAMKRLLILTAMKGGMTQIEIGKALGVSERQVRRILTRTKAIGPRQKPTQEE